MASRRLFVNGGSIFGLFNSTKTNSSVLQSFATSRIRMTDRDRFFGTSSVVSSSFKKRDEHTRRQLFNRRKEAGPEPLRHRNIWQNWNYDAELYGFSKRLNEEFSPETLRLAFMHPSFAVQEAEKRKELMLDELDTVLPDQTSLTTLGKEIVDNYVPAVVRYNFPYFPEEGVRGVSDYLLSENVLATVSFFLGTSDLIMCSDLPPERSTLSNTFLAVIGALAKDCGVQRAEYFVMDFLVTQMLDKDINDYLVCKNPMGIVIDILKREGRGEPESRLLRKTGESTLMAAYLVGIYSDKKLIGEHFGETLLIAEDVAARDTLRRFFRTDLKHRPWITGDAARNLPLENFFTIPNCSLNEWTEKACAERLKQRLEIPVLHEEVRKTLP